MIQYAVLFHHYNLFKLLLDAGANVNVMARKCIRNSHYVKIKPDEPFSDNLLTMLNNNVNNYYLHLDKSFISLSQEEYHYKDLTKLYNSKAAKNKNEKNKIAKILIIKMYSS